MRLAIVHYHLRKGGVTRVIASALEALAGSDTQAVVISSTPSEEPLPCPVSVIPELAYTQDASATQAEALFHRMREAAREQLGGNPDIWHVHNHSLGKNVNFPEALRRLIEDGARVVLQIHDFSEDGRPALYKRQRAAYVDGVFENFELSLYPVAPQIAYAVLNGRDRQILLDAGVPGNRVFWLPNAVTAPTGQSEDKAAVNPRRGAPLLLYPTRAIRRKNLGELLLMAAACPEFHYATTLSPKNPEWKAIHAGWVSLGKELNLPVSFGLAEKRGESFEALVAEAQAMVTTSVGEGFGLAFLEPWLLDKAVIGRDLPAITQDFKENSIRLPNLYKEWRVDCTLLNAEAFKARFFDTACSVYSAYGKPFREADAATAWEDLTTNETVDVGALDETAQAEVLRSVTSAGRAMAPPPCIREIYTGAIAFNRRLIRDLYGISRYRENLEKIHREVRESSPSSPSAADAESILAAFLNMGRLRPLLT